MITIWSLYCCFFDLFQWKLHAEPFVPNTPDWMFFSLLLFSNPPTLSHRWLINLYSQLIDRQKERKKMSLDHRYQARFGKVVLTVSGVIKPALLHLSDGPETSVGLQQQRFQCRPTSARHKNHSFPDMKHGELFQLSLPYISTVSHKYWTLTVFN